MDIKTLTERHPESVSQLFTAFGYDMEPNERNLSNLVKVHGEKEIPGFSSADGAKTTLKDWLRMVLQGTIAVTQAAQNGTAIPSGKSVNVSPDGVTEGPDYSPRILGINRTLFLTIAALFIVAFALILFKK